jgi:hypothetical protein
MTVEKTFFETCSAGLVEITPAPKRKSPAHFERGLG